MSKVIDPAERRRWAEALGVSDAYLYQCLTGRRDMNPGQARQLEDASGGVLKRWLLCQKSWYRIWPELVGREGAPRPNAEQAA